MKNEIYLDVVLNPIMGDLYSRGIMSGGLIFGGLIKTFKNLL